MENCNIKNLFSIPILSVFNFLTQVTPQCDFPYSVHPEVVYVRASTLPAYMLLNSNVEKTVMLSKPEYVSNQEHISVAV